MVLKGLGSKRFSDLGVCVSLRNIRLGNDENYQCAGRLLLRGEVFRQLGHESLYIGELAKWTQGM